MNDSENIKHMTSIVCDWGDGKVTRLHVNGFGLCFSLRDASELEAFCRAIGRAFRALGAPPKSVSIERYKIGRTPMIKVILEQE